MSAFLCFDWVYFAGHWSGYMCVNCTRAVLSKGTLEIKCFAKLSLATVQPKQFFSTQSEYEHIVSKVIICISLEIEKRIKTVN